MNEFRITFGFNGLARSLTWKAESEGEALEYFDEYCERYDADIEFVGIKCLNCEEE